MTGGVTSAQFSPDGQRVVTASAIRRRGCGTRQRAKRLGEPMQHESCVNSAQFSPDGQRVVTASDDKTARVWDAATGKRSASRCSIRAVSILRSSARTGNGW